MLQAYAAVKFADACLRGLRGDAAVVECAFVSSQACIFTASFCVIAHLWYSFITSSKHMLYCL